MWAFVSQGISLGFTAGTSPGPFQSYIIGVTLALGWRRSISAIFSPLVADGPIILLAVVLLKQVPPDFLRVIQIVGGLYLLWLAYGGWRRFRAGAAFANPTTEQQPRTLAQGVTMIWLSPGPYIFWATINGPLLVQALGLSVWHALGFMLGFYGTFLSLLALVVVVFNRVRHLDVRVANTIFLVTLVVMVSFGASLIWQGVTG